jgi:glycosyltransferase involved in cell wall biosynthesis
VRVLIVSHLFAPANAIGSVRVTKFARFLHEAGHDVRILAARDGVLPQDLPVEIPEELVTYVTPSPSTDFLRRSMRGYERNYRGGEAKLPPFIAWGFRMYRALTQIPDAQRRWVGEAVKAGQRLVSEWRPDKIFCSALPISSLVVASRLARAHGIPLVAEMRDLWVDSHYYEMPVWRRWADAWIERRCLEKAELIVTVSEPLAEVLRAKYDKPVIVVLNGFDPADFPVFDAVSRPGDPVRIVYTGLVYPNRQRDPTPLFAALRHLHATPDDFRVEFFGRMLSEVMVIAREQGVEALVRAGSPMPYREALAVQSQADILLLLLWDSPQERGVYSGKLFEYLGARRPILLVGPTEGVAAELIHQRGAGKALREPEAIASYLSRILSEKRATGYVAGLPDYVGEGLTRSDQFALLERSLVHGAPPGSSRRKRVLVVCYRLDIGGTERHLVQVMPRLDPLQFEVRLFQLVPGGVLGDEFRRHGIVVESAASRWSGILGALFAFGSLLRRWRPDVVHFFLPRAYLIAGPVAVLLRHSGLIMSRRSLNHYARRHPFAWRIESLLHRQMKALVGNSSAVVSQLRKESVGRVPVVRIYNGIEVPTHPQLSRSQARRLTGLPEAGLVILVVANLIPYKGHKDFIEAIALLSSRGMSGFQAVCVGRDEDTLGGVQDLARARGIDHCIRWAGEQQDIWPWWRSADIGVLCSHEEGFANVILEGMAMRVPMVVTNVGGNAESVEDGVSGLVVPPRSPVDLAAAIERLLSSGDLRERLAENGFLRVSHEFSLSRCVAEYENLYRQMTPC